MVQHRHPRWRHGRTRSGRPVARAWTSRGPDRGWATVGGLARAITVGGEPIEPYYHHIFPQDHETRELIDELGLADRLQWFVAPMAVMHDGRTMPFDSPLDILRFRALSPSQRLRLAFGSAYQLVRRDRHRMDTTPVGVDGPRWFGVGAYQILWQPLMTAKFGDAADSVAMAWLVARIRQRAGGRRAGGDRLGYLRGSLGTLAEAYAKSVETRGVEIRTNTRATRLTPTDGGWMVETERDGMVTTLRTRSIIACLSGAILGRLVELPPAYRAALDAIDYRGIVCVLLELDRPVSGFYWTNVTDRLGLGCVGIIEHTNFIPAERYDGRRSAVPRPLCRPCRPDVDGHARRADRGCRARPPRIEPRFLTRLDRRCQREP